MEIEKEEEVEVEDEIFEEKSMSDVDEHSESDRRFWDGSESKSPPDIGKGTIEKPKPLST